MYKDMGVFFCRAAAGDMDALGEIYAALSVKIFNYARAITKCREMSEDITHDVFMQILKQAARLSKMANPVAYIMVATRNHAYDYLKRVKRVSPLDDAEIIPASPPFDRFIIEDALSRLPANQRETVYLYYICGFTQKETARIMRVPVVTVKWRCAKAISQLRAHFIKEESDEIARCHN
jgi:RNA polymerase sigma-70 factor (ECF subfamily)